MFSQIINTLNTLNWIDVIFIILLGYFLLTNSGFIDTVFEIFGFLFSLIISYRYYSFFGRLFVDNFAFTRGIANALGFFVAWLLSETFLYIAIALLLQKITRAVRKHPLNYYLGFLVAGFQGVILYLFFISLVFALPVKGQVKEAILESRTGPYFVGLSQSFERQIKLVFNDAVSETLNFITVKPQSDEIVDLNFKLNSNQTVIDTNSEKIMLALLNQERIKRGIAPLQVNEKLQALARNYAEEMLVHGFFAHVSPIDGSSPAQRADRDGIDYLVIGENLAFAPDVYLAHQGLMNSEGHRRNILSADYGKVGIGIVDGGVYGKMFVQEFTN